LRIVLAIGLVVDDAIIVVENVNRHLEEGMEATQAAILAARELAQPHHCDGHRARRVYVPIGFLGGLTGRGSSRSSPSRSWARSSCRRPSRSRSRHDVRAPLEAPRSE